MSDFGAIQNLQAYDPFADVDALDPSGTGPDVADLGGPGGSTALHIRIQQRSGRKTVTTLTGLPATFDPTRILKAFKKDFACNGNVVKDEVLGEVIQVQGDQRAKIAKALKDWGIAQTSDIKIHGF
ncbi:hypothetical protein CXG81DRAFT_27962 [Caulochytrium protostelioides]|uniref:Translation initiation factor eIF1 n=1 Tax=Caulochytrium protostelioides TaxID=1555241 RepID=A0A4P9X1Y5_9FUNG|nr:translation initiation factor eIF1 [Caulochytrium protostelioides]RKO99282.1 hypothetical protein CXG81DRAFT_27962 [Caulochytrium protostelioides]|eukprot:RKO99282.1 hypothetical protein CXG81DRAFT_27962 [Caulochytrium protostelioides]